MAFPSPSPSVIYPTCSTASSGASTPTADANIAADITAELPPLDHELDDSKREYLLAQIRQQGAIIESLVKQVSVYFLRSISFARR